MGVRVVLPTEIGGGPFTVGHALALGVGASRLRGPDLERPFWGIRVPAGSVETLLDQVNAYGQRMSPSAFFSHVTAARLWGIPLPFGLQRRSGLDVAVGPGRVVPVGAGIRGHRLQVDERDLLQFGQIRITSLARTWCDLAALLSEEDLVAAGDFLIWRRRAERLRLTTLDLESALARWTGRRGRPAVERVIPTLTDRADSPPESVMRVRFAKAGLPPPEVNCEIYTEAGMFVAMADLGWRKYRVAFDYEGDVHRTDRLQWAKDLKRAPRLENANWSYVRAGAPDLRDSREIIEILKSKLRKGGWSG
ncbi:MAG: hypothetical protein V4531_07845 [Actinomycetota bacterium]